MGRPTEEYHAFTSLAHQLVDGAEGPDCTAVGGKVRPSARVRGGADTPRSDAFEEADRRQPVKRIAGAEIHVGWKSGSNGAATEGPHVPPTYPRRCA
jgi:hypothetical protein